MATKTENILIFGATGLIGTFITDAIVKDGSFKRVSIFTSPNTISNKSEDINALKSRGVEVIAGDITDADDINKAFNGFDTVVSCVGRPVIHTQQKLIKLADNHPDVKKFFPSEYGTDIEYDDSSVDEKPHQQKIQVRALLKDVKNLEYTYVVTGPYGDADKQLYLSAVPVDKEASGTFDVQRKRAVLLGTGNEKVSLTTMRDVGKLVVAAIKRPEASRNRALKVNSFTATPKEIVSEFEKQTGVESWDISYTSLDKIKELEQEAYANGAPNAGAMTLRRIWTSGGTLYKHRDNDLIGMENKVDSLQSAVKLAIEVQSRRQSEQSGS